jgi:hypothetical protein
MPSNTFFAIFTAKTVLGVQRQLATSPDTRAAGLSTLKKGFNPGL